MRVAVETPFTNESLERSIVMAKGQQRSNREKKKPKSDKKIVVPPVSPFSTPQPAGKHDQGRPGKKAR
jgi:hypothetical protein